MIRVKKIELKHVLGLKEFGIDVNGSVTVIQGRNAAGKSSAIKGIQTLIGGGNLATLQNNDAEEGETAEGVLVLDSDEYGEIIVRKKGARLSVKKQVGNTAAYEDVKPPQRFLEALYDAPAANPVKFITCKDDKERVNLLLDALDLDYDHDVLWERMGLDHGRFRYPRGIHPLKEIAEIRKAVFDERTGVNRDETQKRATVEQLRRQIPASTPTAEDTAETEERLAELQREQATKRSEAHARAKQSKADAVNALNALEADKRAELIKMEQQLKIEMAERMAQAKGEADAEMKIAQTKAAAAAEAADSELADDLARAEQLTEEINALTAEVATMRERAEDSVRIETLRDQANQQEEQADECLSFSKRLTDALSEIDRYKADMVADLPIQGLDITDNVVRIDGVLWGQLNTGEQIKTAVRVACLRLTEKPFRPVFVDGAEALDAEQLGILVKELEAAGAQPFIARVTNGDLSVSSEVC